MKLNEESINALGINKKNRQLIFIINILIKQFAYFNAFDIEVEGLIECDKGVFLTIVKRPNWNLRTG